MIQPSLLPPRRFSASAFRPRRRTLPELSYGAAVTSNYIDKGTAQSDGKPAVQGYVEGAYGIFYGGVWSSTVDIDSATTSRSTSMPGCGRACGDLTRRLQLSTAISMTTVAIAAASSSCWRAIRWRTSARLGASSTTTR